MADCTSAAARALSAKVGHMIARQASGDHTCLEAQIVTAQADGLDPNILRTLAFVGCKGPVEFQALNVKQGRYAVSRAAHAVDIAAAVELSNAAERWPSDGVYIIPAVLRAGVETRNSAPGSWFDMAKGASTTDSDIAARLVLSVDCDVKRPSGISATDAEMALSAGIALRVFEYLARAVGCECLAYVHSGNGR